MYSLLFFRNHSKKHPLHPQGSRGFTLIELLTVIGIIAVLTGLFTVSYLAVRQRGRDAQRKSNIKQMQSALELYRADNDSYPPSATFQALVCGQTFTSPSGTVTYMNALPCDPTTGGTYYYFRTSPTTYVIASCLENTSDKDAVNASAVGTQPLWWSSTETPPPNIAWPPATTCTSGYYYLSSNP